MQKQKIVIVLDEGVVTHVFSSMDANVEVLDFDEYADYSDAEFDELNRKWEDVKKDPNMKDMW